MMGLLSFITGKSPEEMEISADRYFEAGEYGFAKVEYEKALERAERKCPEKPHLIERLREKAAAAKEALARHHVDIARELAVTESTAEAEELLNIALELTGDDKLKQDIKDSLSDIRNKNKKSIENFDLPPASEAAADREIAPAEDEDRENHGGDEKDFYDDDADPDELEDHDDEDDDFGDYENADDHYYDILLSTLPEDIRAAFHSYGDAFREGYVALNRGDFEAAVERFFLARRENPAGHLILLELATALLHLKRRDEAREMLEGFVHSHPGEVRGYQLLCDIYWEIKEFSAAESLIRSCPEALRNDQPMVLLTGETLYLQRRYDEAVDLYERYLEENGFDEIVSRALARTYEAMEDVDTARRIYGKIIKGCATCGIWTDPFAKQRYAELGFKSGDRSDRLIALYQSLIHEDPDNRADYFKRISQIYEERGEYEEAGRYAALQKQGSV